MNKTIKDKKTVLISLLKKKIAKVDAFTKCYLQRADEKSINLAIMYLTSEDKITELIEENVKDILVGNIKDLDDLMYQN